MGHRAKAEGWQVGGSMSGRRSVRGVVCSSSRGGRGRGARKEGAVMVLVLVLGRRGFHDDVMMC